MTVFGAGDISQKTWKFERFPQLGWDLRILSTAARSDLGSLNFMRMDLFIYFLAFFACYRGQVTLFQCL